MRAIQIKQAADNEVILHPVTSASLARIEPVKDLDLQARQEMRHLVTRHQHGVRVPADGLTDMLKYPLVLAQVMSIDPISHRQPGSLAAASPNGLLQRPQNRKTIVVLDVEQVTLHARAPSASSSR